MEKTTSEKLCCFAGSIVQRDTCFLVLLCVSLGCPLLTIRVPDASWNEAPAADRLRAPMPGAPETHRQASVCTRAAGPGVWKRVRLSTSGVKFYVEIHSFRLICPAVVAWPIQGLRDPSS